MIMFHGGQIAVADRRLGPRLWCVAQRVVEVGHPASQPTQEVVVRSMQLAVSSRKVVAPSPGQVAQDLTVLVVDAQKPGRDDRRPLQPAQDR